MVFKVGVMFTTLFLFFTTTTLVSFTLRETQVLLHSTILLFEVWYKIPFPNKLCSICIVSHFFFRIIPVVFVFFFVSADTRSVC